MNIEPSWTWLAADDPNRHYRIDAPSISSEMTDAKLTAVYDKVTYRAAFPGFWRVMLRRIRPQRGARRTIIDYGLMALATIALAIVVQSFVVKPYLRVHLLACHLAVRPIA